MMQPQSQSGAGWFLLFSIFFPVFFLSLWCGVCCLLSLTGGWYSLGSKYGSRRTIAGHHFHFASMSMGRSLLPVNYNGCLFITVGEEGIALSILFFFKPLHPPLLIPWSAIETCTRRKFWFFERAVITISNPKQQMAFDGKASRAILICWDKE
jgi:hypothetical protein